ncbi:MAG: hypothetical protein AB2A00_23295 [Myxococcota bacterium]
MRFLLLLFVLLSSAVTAPSVRALTQAPAPAHGEDNRPPSDPPSDDMDDDRDPDSLRRAAPTPRPPPVEPSAPPPPSEVTEPAPPPPTPPVEKPARAENEKPAPKVKPDQAAPAVTSVPDTEELQNTAITWGSALALPGVAASHVMAAAINLVALAALTVPAACPGIYCLLWCGPPMVGMLAGQALNTVGIAVHGLASLVLAAGSGVAAWLSARHISHRRAPILPPILVAMAATLAGLTVGAVLNVFGTTCGSCLAFCGGYYWSAAAEETNRTPYSSRRYQVANQRMWMFTFASLATLGTAFLTGVVPMLVGQTVGAVLAAVVAARLGRPHDSSEGFSNIDFWSVPASEAPPATSPRAPEPRTAAPPPTPEPQPRDDEGEEAGEDELEEEEEL